MNEAPNRNLALDLVRVTEAAALAAAPWMGRGQKEAGDQAAVEAMRLMLSTIDMDGIVVIGEGAKDEAPMLYNGEKVGNGNGPQVDVAVDPVEGTALLASGRPDSISVIGVAPRGAMWLPGPSFYMNKVVVGSAAREALSPDLLQAPVKQLIQTIADALGKPPHDLTVFILDKPRHQELIHQVRETGARVLLRTDGDVAGSLMALRPDSGVDMLLGIGGTPEGIITACAVRAMGGAMLAQLAPQKPGEREAVLAAGLDVEHVFTEQELVRSEDVFFAATGITDGVLLPGVHYYRGGAITTSLVMRGKTGTVRLIRAEHQIEKLRRLSGRY